MIIKVMIIIKIMIIIIMTLIVDAAGTPRGLRRSPRGAHPAAVAPEGT